MEYLLIIFLIILLLVLNLNKIKEKFDKILVSPDILEVIKSGPDAKIVFSSNQEDNDEREYKVFYIDEEMPDKGVWVQRKVFCNSKECEFVISELKGSIYHLTIVETNGERMSPMKQIVKFGDGLPYKLARTKPEKDIIANNVKQKSVEKNNPYDLSKLEEEYDLENNSKNNSKNNNKISHSPSPYVECGNPPKVKYVTDKSEMEDIEVKTKCEEDPEIERIYKNVNRNMWDEVKQGFVDIDLILGN